MELRAAGGVVAQTGATQALFVLLVALLARVLVLADQVEELARDPVQVRVGHRLGKVGVEVALACGRVFLVERDDSATVLGVLDVNRVVLQLNHFAFRQFVFFDHRSILQMAYGFGITFGGGLRTSPALAVFNTDTRFLSMHSRTHCVMAST